MTNSSYTDAEVKCITDMRKRGYSYRDIADRLGRSERSVAQKVYLLKLASPESPLEVKPQPKVQQIPSANRSIDEIFEDQVKEFERKSDHHKVKREGVNIEMPDDGPYGLFFFGDPHTDDGGTDLSKLAYDMATVARTPHLHGALMGDLTNNWVGQLKRLYGVQGTTEDEAEKLMDWLLGKIPWLFCILGNHDKWGPLASRICKEKKVLGVSHGAMFNIASGQVTTVVDARHTHPGSSMYNPAFAQGKQAFRGSRADIIIGAHIHASAAMILKNEVTGQIAHAIRVGAYKIFDDYADQLGYGDGQISPSVICVVNPHASPEGKVHVFHDVDMGVMFLETLRTRWEGNAA